MFKMMERGELLAADVLPKVAKQMRLLASTGLEQKLKTTRVAQGRFFNELQKNSNLIFTSGFDEGLANLFNTLAVEIKDSTSGLKGLGTIFKAVFNIITSAVKIVTPLFDSLFFVVGRLIDAFELLFPTALHKFAAMLGVGAFAAKKFGKELKLAFAFLTPVKIGLLAVIGLLDEVFSLFTRGRVGILEIALGKDIAGWDELMSELQNADTSAISDKLAKTIEDTFSKIEWGKAFDGFVEWFINFATWAPRMLLKGFTGIIEGATDWLPEFTQDYARAAITGGQYHGLKSLTTGSFDPMKFNQVSTAVNIPKAPVIQTNSPKVEVNINGSGLNQQQLEAAIRGSVPSIVDQLNQQMFNEAMTRGN